MAGPKIFDVVQDTTTTTGTGTVSLANSAPTGFRTFGSVLSNGDTTLYSIRHTTLNEWEVGLGTYTSSGTTLARTTVLSSSNSNAAVNFSAGTKNCGIVWSADFPNQFLNPTAAFASLTSFQAGRLGFPSDGMNLYRDTGSTLSPWGPIFPLTPFVDSGFTWRNQGTSSLTAAYGTTYFSIPASASNNVRAYTKAKSAPYTMTVAFLPCLIAASTAGAYGGRIGLCFYDGTKFASFSIDLCTSNASSDAVFMSMKWTNSTTQSATYVSRGFVASGSPVFLRIADDNSNRICSVSSDGQNWAVIHTVTRTDFLTPTEAGLFFEGGTANIAQNASIIHFVET